MAVHSPCSSVVGLVCLAVLTLPGCGGGGHPANEPVSLTVGTGAAATESRRAESTYRSEDFIFVLPAGWVELPASSSRSYGQVASAASIAPEGTAPSSLVLVLAYDVSGQSDSADGARAWFEWYARTNDAEVTQPASEIALAGGAALQGSLRWTDGAGNPVDVRIVRAVRRSVLYLIQCQAERADRAAIAAGCATIVKSFRGAPG